MTQSKVSSFECTQGGADRSCMKIVIMAGGKGTRMASVSTEIAKPMIPILNKPILEYQIEILKKQGYTDILLVIGYLGKQVKEYFGDGSKSSPVTGEKFGVNIRYFEETTPLGTAGSLFYIKDEITEDFLLLNGDIIFDINIERFFRFHKEKGGIATLFTHPNNHPYDSGIIIAGKNGCVENWFHKEDARKWYRNRVNAGIHMFSPEIFRFETEIFKENKKLDLDREVLIPLIESKQVYAYDSPEYVKDMGTPERFYNITEDIKTGKVKDRNLTKKQKAVFLDRDGTINKYVGFLRRPEEMELLPGAAEAVKRINQSDYLAILITNQPIIARGEVTEEELNEIHNKMETLLGREGAYLDAIYFCPHHPQIGYAGEIMELKFDCSCRKPKPGMLFKARDNFNIDLSKSWMVGDSACDIEAGKAAGCKTCSVGAHKVSEPHFNNLLEFAEKIV